MFWHTTFFLLVLSSIFYDFFLLYCPNLFPIELHCLFLAQIPSISSLKGMEGVGACFCTGYGPIQTHTLDFCLSGNAMLVLFRDIIFNQPLLNPLNPVYQRKPLLSRKHLHVAGCPYLFFRWRNQNFSRFLSSFTYYHW